MVSRRAASAEDSYIKRRGYPRRFCACAKGKYIPERPVVQRMWKRPMMAKRTLSAAAFWRGGR